MTQLCKPLLLVFIPTSKSHVAFLPWYLQRGCLSCTAQYKKTHKQEFYPNFWKY